jgi:NDP-sugar pyrophosphorylase family protein
MPLGEKPILEILINQLCGYGFNEIVLAVGHLSELITAYFGDGSKFGVSLRYSKEDAPLGTAGPISLVEDLDETFLVMNGDILTILDYAKFVSFHKAHGNIATVAVNRRNVNIDYGIIHFDDNKFINKYIEKPVLDYHVSMGIYIFEPHVLKYIKKDQKCDLPDLVKKLLKEGEKVSVYQSDDYWLDIGRHEDYEKALREFKRIEKQLLVKGASDG